MAGLKITQVWMDEAEKVDPDAFDRLTHREYQPRRVRDFLTSVLGWAGVLLLVILFWYGFGRGVDGETRDMDIFYSEQ